MRRTFRLLTAGAALTGWVRGADLPQKYSQYGTLILAPLASAPFPDAKRAEGHRYQGQFYSAPDHYADNTVAIFVPRGFRETGRIDFIVHFHGWRNTVEGVLGKYHLIEQLVQSGRNAILVVPQGPRDAPDSCGGKLEEPEGFQRLMTEVCDTLRQKRAVSAPEVKLGRIILSGHSGAYRVMGAILDRGGLTEAVQEVWLFDALYAQTDQFLAWAEHHSGRLLNLYTDQGGTRRETEGLMDTLKQRHRPFYAGTDGEATTAELQTNRLVFLHTDLPHDEVLEKRHAFQRFIETSALAPGK